MRSTARVITPLNGRPNSGVMLRSMTLDPFETCSAITSSEKRCAFGAAFGQDDFQTGTHDFERDARHARAAAQIHERRRQIGQICAGRAAST
jgi:hypothetical protein